ncbi:MAG: DNA polymerase III subunit alpha [Opitutaceae bacterium]
MNGYVELHARSAFSFLRGASCPEELVSAAAHCELPAMALCDCDGVYGAPRLFNAARESGVRALVGAEITLQNGSVLPLLVSSKTGYSNLCRLITEAKLQPRNAIETAGRPQRERRHVLTLDNTADRPKAAGSIVKSQDMTSLMRVTSLMRARKRPCFATWEEIARFSEGLIALTGDEKGPVRRAWASGGDAAAEQALRTITSVFGPERVHVEVQRHNVRGEERALHMLARLAEANGLPLLATGGVDYAAPEDREIADVFTCLRHHVTLDTAGRRLAPNAGRHVRDARAMHDLFRDMPKAVENSVRLAEKMNFTLRDLGYRFPDFEVPQGETQQSWLRKLAFAGARERCGAMSCEVRAQLEKEFTLIEKLGFCGYFLIVWDICAWCRQRGILVQGRGSSANSLVCYALGITAADPIKCKLLFERFLSEGRIGADGHPSWPDIDLDLPSGDLRESVIQEIYRRYAPRGAGMTANVITYRGRSSARELGKVLDLPEGIIDTFSSLFANGDFPHTLDLQKQMAMAGLPRGHPRLPAFLRLYRRIRGLPRHLGQHSGGMVICGGALDGVVPLEPASMPDRVVVQWDKDDCEELGIVKVDFLGLGMMAVLQDSFALSKARGRPCELHTIPQDNEPTFAMMQAADTIGVFQIESRAQMTTLKRFKPATFYDVAIEVAIVRPGPIVGNVAHPMLRRRAGLEEIICLDPSVHEIMKPALERTYGIILFQEQMLQVAMTLAGFTATEAEELRRAMGFTKGTERLERVLRKLRESMRSRGHSEQVIDIVVDSASSFALYGFPEAHAISFGLLAYASTWLKAHRAPEFFASLLDNQPMGFYSPATLIQDARRHGLRVRPPDVMVSEWRCTVEDDRTIRLGLKQVRGVRENNAARMLAARAEQAFASMEDFQMRTDFSRAERRALAAVGALNALASHRRSALWRAEEDFPEEDLFTRAAREAQPGPEQDSPLAPMSRLERVQADYAEMSLTTGAHPMKFIRDRLTGVVTAADLARQRNGARVTIAGAVICRQRPGTAKGFVFISLEDETGVANAIVVPDLFEKRRLMITQESFLRITGRLQNDDGVIHVKAARIEPLLDHALPAEASHDFH